MMIAKDKFLEIKSAAEKITAFYGVALDSIEFVKDMGHDVLRLIIDKPEGIAVSECEQVSRAFNKKLDELDIVKEQYFLEVSSPGKGDYQGVPNLNKID